MVVTIAQNVSFVKRKVSYGKMNFKGNVDALKSPQVKLDEEVIIYGPYPETSGCGFERPECFPVLNQWMNNLETSRNS
ncbi:hypothetical protein VNO77_04501 [Canavalia gladiata]|uniref:Uncharacterized protein n=1 Tax=Canavalia gladiata TaxID=3824 RepID=A0AAN9R4U5_CANGL